MKHADRAVKQTLSATPECVAPERFADPLSDAERRHVEDCSHCQTELQLWREFERAEPSADEGAAVQWIVAELRRRNSPAAEQPARPRFAWLTPVMRRVATAVAALALVTTVGFLAWDREPAVRELTGTPDTYRTGQLQIARPLGDQQMPPDSLQWIAPAGAVSYDIQVSEVDGTPLWHATSAAPHIDVPDSVIRQFRPGKTVVWEVRARNAANTVIAESGTQRFRVELPK